MSLVRHMNHPGSVRYHRRSVAKETLIRRVERAGSDLIATLSAHAALNSIDGAAVIASVGDEVVLEAGITSRNSKDFQFGVETLVPAFSMTKLLTTIVALQSVERGVLALDDNLAFLLPSFGNAHVGPLPGRLAGPTTFHHLLTHSAGFTGSSSADDWLDRLYAEAGVYPFQHDGHEVLTETAFYETLAKLPRLFDPGTYWAYGRSHDVVGHALEKLYGLRFDTILQDNLCAPLGLHDTGFQVRPVDLHRLVIPSTTTDVSRYLRFAVAEPRFVSAGSGLFTSARDYHRLLSHLMQTIHSNESGILSPASVAMLRQKVLPYPVGSVPDIFPGHEWGFGLGLAARQRGDQTRLSWLSRTGSGYAIDFDTGLVIVAMIMCRAVSNRFYFFDLHRTLDRYEL